MPAHLLLQLWRVSTVNSEGLEAYFAPSLGKKQSFDWGYWVTGVVVVENDLGLPFLVRFHKRRLSKSHPSSLPSSLVQVFSSTNSFVRATLPTRVPKTETNTKQNGGSNESGVV